MAMDVALSEETPVGAVRLKRRATVLVCLDATRYLEAGSFEAKVEPASPGEERKDLHGPVLLKLFPSARGELVRGLGGGKIEYWHLADYIRRGGRIVRWASQRTTLRSCEGRCLPRLRPYPRAAS